MALKVTQDISQYHVRVLDLGRWIEERINGTAGRRKRGSWWGMQLRKTVPERAERSGSCEDFHFGEETRSQSAGPRRSGREATRCW